MMQTILADNLIPILNILFVLYATYALQKKNAVTQDAIALKVIQEKINKYDALEKSQETIKADFETYKRRLDEQTLSNMAMSRTIEDQARKITQLTVDLQSLTTDHELLKNEKRTLEDHNRNLAQEIARANVERDLATAKYEVLHSALGRIHINVTNLEVKPNES